MNQRIHEALDGEIERSQLTAAEQEALRQAELELRAVLRAIPGGEAPDLAESVMARIRSTVPTSRQPLVIAADVAQPAGRTGDVAWIWRPRPISFAWRPVYAIAAGLLLAVLSLRAVIPGGREHPPATVHTRFVLHVPNASTVSLAGDFTGWQATVPLARSGTDLWSVVVPLAPGVHTYAFVVDGERWVADPLAPSVDDGFGGVNSRVAVLTPDARKS